MNKQGPGKIEYCDYTWNPAVGCRHNCSYCYARRIATRFAGGKAFPYGFEPTFHPERLDEPLKVKKPARIFMGDMADLMGDWDWKDANQERHGKGTSTRYGPGFVIPQVIDIVRRCPQHTFLFLTKNPARYAEFEWPENCWLGTTVTCPDDADDRIPALLKARAKLYWVSYEPALGPINIVKYLGHQTHECKCGFHDTELDLHFAGGKFLCLKCGTVCTDRPGIGWVAYGPETGPGRRPTDPALMWKIQEQCEAAGIPAFMKAMEVMGQLYKTDGQLAALFEGAAVVRRVRRIPGVEYSELPLI